MIIKLIIVHVKRGHMDAYLAAQDVWNKETQNAAGYLGALSGRDTAEPNTVYVQCFWQSRADLDRWMETEHDRIAAIAKAGEHYERIEVKIIDTDSSMSL